MSTIDTKTTEMLPYNCDPNLRNMPSCDNPVDIGDKCSVNRDFLENLELPIQWAHSSGPKRDIYYLVAFKNVTKGMTSTTLVNIKHRHYLLKGEVSLTCLLQRGIL
jgi:hypothetical protein